MDDNSIFKVKSKYYEIIDFPGISKGLNPLHYSINLRSLSAHLNVDIIGVYM